MGVRAILAVLLRRCPAPVRGGGDIPMGVIRAVLEKAKLMELMELVEERRKGNSASSASCGAAGDQISPLEDHRRTRVGTGGSAVYPRLDMHRLGEGTMCNGFPQRCGKACGYST